MIQLDPSYRSALREPPQNDLSPRRSSTLAFTLQVLIGAICILAITSGILVLLG